MIGKVRVWTLLMPGNQAQGSYCSVNNIAMTLSPDVKMDIPHTSLTALPEPLSVHLGGDLTSISFLTVELWS